MQWVYRHWLLQTEGRVATLTLNRPAGKNCLSEATLVELGQVTAYLSTLDDIWVVILRGQGAHFSIGYDLDELATLVDMPQPDARQYLLRMQLSLDTFEVLEKPTIAQIQGFCLGGGLMLALCCDFRIASRHSVFSLPEVRRGLPVLLGTRRISRVTGVAVAKELTMLGKRFNAQKALSYGLATQVVEPERLESAVDGLSRRLLRLPPRSVALAKRIALAGYDRPIRQSQEMELDALSELHGSRDLREAIAAYLEARTPEYTGS
jgi:enoyl-CoA hydratase/carnithine racemase